MKNKNLKVFIILLCLFLFAALAGCKDKEQDENEEENQTGFVAMDYSNIDNWVVNDYNNEDKKDTQVDVFFIYPTNTGVSDQENGIANITEEFKATVKKADVGSTDCFNDGVRFYEPYYRQLGMVYELEHVLKHEDLPNLLRETEAKVDLFAALDYYFENCNNGRPFIIAGFSQGAAAVQLVLEDYFGQTENRQLVNRMIAAYSIGYGIDKNWLASLDYLKFATGATDTGVVISWNTEGPGEKTTNVLLANNPADTLVINPINWKTDATPALASECLGTSVNGEVVTPGSYNLVIDPDRGCLICDNNENYIVFGGSPVFGGKSLHMFEIPEAYLSIRQNMHDRIDAYFAK